VHFTREIKVTIEHGHANYASNEMSSVAYWYAERPGPVASPPPVSKRLPLRRDHNGNWERNAGRECPGPEVPPTEQMREMLRRAEDNR
jgi:hypothetical protein